MSEFEIPGTDRGRNNPPEVQQPQPAVTVKYVDRVVYKERSTLGHWIAIAILGLTTVAFLLFGLAMLMATLDQEETINSLNYDVDMLRQQQVELTAEKEAAESALGSLTERIGSSYPLIINSVEIGNVHQDNEIITNYGSTIYSYEAEYLKPKIKYYGIIDGQRMLKTKWIRPDGSIIAGDSSPRGFSQGADYEIVSGSGNELEMGGWGWSNSGNWTSGTYRLEIWYGNTCLNSHTFTVY
ncbi:MAG: hypothetical protein UH625_10820 [Muribaculaceae bacterium]|nr:hypothetical protein [Muribaculaceae bacterium]